jgi:hypothetical protein
VATFTIGPTQPSGRRTIADANALSLSSGDVVQFESIDQSGPFATATRLAARAGVIYDTLDEGHQWGITGMGGVDLATNGATLRWFRGDGGNLSGSQGIATTGQAQNVTLQHVELTGYALEAIKSTHGQWADHVNGVTPGSGPNDSGWLVEDLYVHDTSLGAGVNAWFHYGSGLTFRRCVWRNAGGDHAFYPKARGLRGYDSLFDQCVSPLSLRTGDQLLYRMYFDHCVNPVTSFPYDFTGLGGKQALYGVVLRSCSDGGAGGPLLFFDENNHEAGGDLKHADYDVVVYDLSMLDSCSAAQGLDFRDFTIAGRHVKLRNVSHGKNVAAPFRTGYTAANLDSDYGAYPNGGKPAGETHSITPTNTQISEATNLPVTGSALLGAGTTTADGTDYTPRTADIGFKGYPSPVTGGAAAWHTTPILASTPGAAATATPGGSFTPATPLLIDDEIVYAVAFNQNNLGDLVVTPPTGYSLRSSKSVTDRQAVYIATRKVVSGDTLTGAITLPTWLIQDGTGTNQARNFTTWVAVARGANATTPVPTGGTGTGGNSGAQATGATAATTITSPEAGSLAFGVVTVKPGQTVDTTTLDTTNSVPAGTTGDHWTRHDEQLAGTAAGAASIGASAYSAVLAAAVQAKLAVTFSPSSQWAAAVIELAPAAGSTTDTTAPDPPARSRVERVASTLAVITSDLKDYGSVSGGGGGPGSGSGWADVGSPLNWWKLTQDGGLRPSATSRDPSAVLGPRTAAYYTNLPLRDIADPSNARGTLISGTSVRYYPRSRGYNIVSIDFSDPAHFKITLEAPPASSGDKALSVGMVVQVRDTAPAAGPGSSPLRPKKPNGQYTIQSISGSIITFTTGAPTTSGTYNSGSGFVIAESEGRGEPVLYIDVAEGSIGSAGDSHGPLFLPFDPAAATSTRGTPANPWVLQHGYTNAMHIAGNVSAQANGGVASLSVMVPPWFDMWNASSEYLTYGGVGDPQLYNPFCHLELTNVNLIVQDGMGGYGLTGTLPGVVAGYSEPLSSSTVVIHGVPYTGLQIPTGEGIGWSGCSGVVRALMNHDFVYDGNKFGSGAGLLRWEWCTNFRNRFLVDAGGGHTDTYQVWDLINTGLGSFVDAVGRTWPLAPTWYRCYFENGGNAQLFLNDGGGSGNGEITDVWLLECISGTGNKFLLAAGCTNVGARRCLINGVPPGTGGMVGQRPDPLDYGSNDGTLPCSQGAPGVRGDHPCPAGTLAWPDPSGPNADDANLQVLIDGSTTPVDREVPGTSRPCTPGVCFDYVD